MTEKETWENAANGPRYIRVFEKGDERLKKVASGARISLTPEEREMNQIKVLNEGQDFFSNGDLMPVKLIESASDYEEVASNPNLMGEDELKDLFNLKNAEFADAISNIQSLRVVELLEELANDVGSVAKGKRQALADKKEDLQPKRQAMSPFVDEDEGEPVE